MISCNTELTMSHVGLGTLNEYALLVAFGNAHSKALVAGLSITASEIVDNDNRLLYPAYFMTRITVPPDLLLHGYGLWDRLDVGVEVKRFGDTLLDSKYIVMQENDESEPAINDLLPQRVSMQANSLFVVDASVAKTTDRQVAIPRPGCLASMDKLAKPPEAIRRAREVRNHGFAEEEGMSQFRNTCPIAYDLIPGRDSHAGHAMIFAKFSEIMDFAEFTLLTKLSKPGIPLGLYDCIHLLERETYYYGNCFGGEQLNIFVKGKFSGCAPDFHGKNLRMVSAGIFTFVVEIYQAKNNMLLSIAKVKKLIALPVQFQELKFDMERIFSSALQ